MSTTPTAAPARFPAGYGRSEGPLMEWADVAERVAASPNYWVATTTVDGRPHLRPVDGVFVETTLAFGGSPGARWVRHLQLRPSVSVSLPDDDHAVILEGVAALVAEPDATLSALVAAANAAKYPQFQGEGGPSFRPYWALRPHRVYAWTLTGFPSRATRFDFATDAP